MGKKGYGSAYGEPQRTCYWYINYLKKYFKRDFNVLVIDALDGLHVLPFARHGIHADCYETNKKLLYAGKIDDYVIKGLYKKIKCFNLSDYINVYERNFYDCDIDKKYDFVYVYRSLHLDKNKNIELDKKIKKILSCVKVNGFVYILYHLSNTDFDYHTYSKNQYLRKGQMSKMFNYTWKILDNHERNMLTIHKSHPFHL